MTYDFRTGRISLVSYAIAYDIAGLTYDIVYDGVGNIVGQSGENESKTYDIVGFSYDIVGIFQDRRF